MTAPSIAPRRLPRLATGLVMARLTTASVACGVGPEPAAGPTDPPTATSAGIPTTVGPRAAPSTPTPGPSTTDDQRSSTVQIRMTVGEDSATATLADNATARDFASLLPVTLNMSDLFGLEKLGKLPRALNQGGKAVFTYEVGQLGYWSPGEDLAIVYAVKGSRSIPSPGLVPIGTVDSGLEMIAEAGDAFQLRIEQVN